MSNKALSAVGFAEAVITHWPPFRWDEHQELSWTQSLVRELGGFEQQVLGNALAHLIRTRRDTKTPTVAICIDACATERRYFEAQKRMETLPAVDPERDASKFPAYSPGRKDTVDKIIKCPLGKKAAKEGWIGTMYAFAMEHGRLPGEMKVAKSKLPRHPTDDYVGMSEIEMCKQQAKDFDATYSLCVRGETSVSRQWESTGAAMLEARRALANMVLEAR